MTVPARGKTRSSSEGSFLKGLRQLLLYLLPAVALGFFVLSLVREDVPFWTHMFRITLAGVVGFYTNWIAIKMLFYPKEPLPLSGWQGLVPKNRGRLAREVGDVVQQQLLSPEIITDHVMKDDNLEKAGRWVTGALVRWLDSRENRKRVEQWVGNGIRKLGSDSLDPTLDRLLEHLYGLLDDRERLLGLLDSLRGGLQWLVENRSVQEAVERFVSRLVDDSLDDEGVASKLISRLVSELETRLADREWQETATDYIVTRVRETGQAQMEPVFDFLLARLERAMADRAMMSRFTNTLSRALSSAASDDKVVDFVTDQLLDLMRQNSESLGEMINEAIKDNANLLQRFLKSIFLPQALIIRKIDSLSSDPSIREKIRTFLLQKADIAKTLQSSKTRAKLLGLVSRNRGRILGWCSTRGKELLMNGLSRLLASDDLWELIRERLGASSPVIVRYARSLVPRALRYMREALGRTADEKLLRDWLKEQQHSLADRLASPATAESIASFIEAHSDQLDGLIEGRLRPFLLDHSARILSSDGFWDWIEEHVGLWIPKLTEWLETALSSNAFIDSARDVLPRLASGLDIDRIVEDRVSAYEPDELERLVDRVSGENLAGIEVFGGILGMAVGTLTVVSECWYYSAVVIGLVAIWSGAEIITKSARKAR